MRHLLSFCTLSLAVCSGAALAESCPAAPNHEAALEGLLEQVQRAENETDARLVANQMWQYWADAPDERAQEMLDRGMRRRSGFDFLGALEDFDRLIAYCPEYAEGYNQRAFVHYLRRDFAAAVSDLERALALSPRHVAALSGRALALYGLDRLEEARLALAEALVLNPWLPERSLAVPGGPLHVAPPQGTDL